ncbi:MAG: DinB family protein [Gemmatimonadota bacterium]
MPIAELLIPEFDNEMGRTRRVLERLPDGKLDWRPHEKSWTLRELATHVAQIPGWLTYAIRTDELDIAPVDGPPMEQPRPESTAGILALFEGALGEARAALAGTKDDAFDATWTLKAGGKTIFSASRYMVVRETVLNHLVHHRGQLTVYLRQCGAPVPGTYGPSADEPNS